MGFFGNRFTFSTFLLLFLTSNSQLFVVFFVTCVFFECFCVCACEWCAFVQLLFVNLCVLSYVIYCFWYRITDLLDIQFKCIIYWRYLYIEKKKKRWVSVHLYFVKFWYTSRCIRYTVLERTWLLLFALFTVPEV